MAAAAPPAFADSDSYERLMGRWSVRLAPRFVEFAGPGNGAPVLDVGCGTGSLVQALAEGLPDSRVVGIDPAAGFVEHCRGRFPQERFRFDVGSALDLPYDDAAFGHALSMLVLMFIRDPLKAVREMRRVTKPGGTVSACTWDRDGLEMTAVLWKAAEELDPPLSSRRAPALVVHEGQLSQVWKSAGLADVREDVIRMRMDFPSFDDYWAPFLTGTSPLGVYIAQLDAASRENLRSAVHGRLYPGGGDGPLAMEAKALVVRGTVPGQRP